MEEKRIESALVSVYSKAGLDKVAVLLEAKGVKIYSTGGTQAYLESKGCEVHRVEDLTSYPSILGGRVKTLHPKVFGGILAKRSDSHRNELEIYGIPEIDLVVVDLYPFEETVRAGGSEEEVIEKIDIGGISLIRAAAKNYRDVLVISDKADYGALEEVLSGSCATSLEERKAFAGKAFRLSSNYDTAIYGFFTGGSSSEMTLRYGENPHQGGVFRGDVDKLFNKLSGKELSYNNLVDVDAAIELMAEFKDEAPTFAVLKHTNACGVATRGTVADAWSAALAGDPVSAFGGILICNAEVDEETANEIDKIFYEVLIAPSFSARAIEILIKKKKRVLLELKGYPETQTLEKTLLNGVIVQDRDMQTVQSWEDVEVVTKVVPSDGQKADLLFAEKCAKHLKSNTIVLVKDMQLLGMGCGQTSRVDACRQAIEKAGRMGMDLSGAVMASDAFFPFPDCVEIAYEAGVVAVIQPGGSIKDTLSIEYCDQNGMSMVFTGIRHFKH